MSSEQQRTAGFHGDTARLSAERDSVSDQDRAVEREVIDSTWDPGVADPFDSDGFVNDAEAGGAAPGPAPDPEKTIVQRGSTGVADVWGDQLEDITPNMTLKEPGRTRRSARCPPATATGAGLPDTTVEGYELQKVLGEGGVGIVFQAIQKSIDREIAVKMIRPAVGGDARERQKFIAEAMVTGDLDHPNIVPIHDLGQSVDGQPYYAMKLVRGRRWSETIREAGLPENLRILLDVCDAVDFAHSKGVIHRDLKPDNVMLGEFGEVQLMDWGLGATVADRGKAPLTASQAAGGTPAYMAPEMVTGENWPVGFHSDIYLLGAILYEIVTGRPPHPGTRVLEALENALNNVIAPAEQGGVLIDIAMKAMKTDPADRHGSVKDFKQAILDYQAHAESIATCDRAAFDLHRARQKQDYELFAQALFGFRRALQLWEGNPDARSGLQAAQLQYARCAFDKGDFDLALITLDANCAAHRELVGEIRIAQQKRAGSKRRLRILRNTAIALTAAVIIILTVASIWIAAARREAVEAKEAAVAAHRAETRQRRLAEEAKALAQREEARAVQALADLERAVQAMVVAQTHEERALAKARAAELVAIETRDELARTGMLLDNSWWVFDAEAARRRQQETADRIGMPVELSLTLPEDVSLELVLIPSGEFVMGSPPRESDRAADEYLHRVRHTRPYYLGRFELTEAQWQALTGEPPPAKPEGELADPPRPIVGLSMDQIEQRLLPALRRHAPPGWTFRMPSEAEWEYACRAGTAAAYHSGDGGDALELVGWYLHNSGRQVQPVGAKQPNAFGLHDMHGNVGEICADGFDAGYYLEAPTDDPVCAGDDERFVVRGGSVLNTPTHCRSAYRSYVYRRNRYEFIGLRVALVPTTDQ